MASAMLCFSGFSRDEIPLLHEQFEQANAATGAQWTLAAQAEASVLVIDMDSMYGHMTWLQATSSGKTTVGLTAGERAETDFLLRRPVSVESLKTLLLQITSGQPSASAGPAAPKAEETRVDTPMLASPATTPDRPGGESTPVQNAEAQPPAPSPSASAEYIAAFTTGQMAALGPTVAHQQGLSDFLAPGALTQPVLLQLPDVPALALDPATQTYAGSATLKPLLPILQAALAAADFVAIDRARFDAIASASGGAQPYMRLIWLCGLSAGNGHLLPGFNPAKKVELTKWPQIEREYPKHFRLATVMMKGPALVRELAETSGVALPEVIDFVNACLLTGVVVVEGSASSAGDVARASALLARPRSA